MFLNFFYKILVYIGYKKQIYVFNTSKKYISSWGKKTYGYPVVSCFDEVSRLSVGNYTSIASNVSVLLGSNHKRGLITTYPRALFSKKTSHATSNEPGDVVIGSDVWIGYGVTIIGPAVIGDGAIIGAGALVIKDVPPYAVVGGVPAQILKYRFNENEIENLLSLAWWNKDEDYLEGVENEIYSKDVSAFVSRCK